MKKTITFIFAALFILMAALIFVPGKNAKAADTTAPVIDPTSLTVDKTTVEHRGKVTFSVKITDESEIADALLWIIGTKADEVGGGVYNSKTGLWDFEVTNKYFGLNEIDHIYVTDVYGNRRIYYNSASERVDKGHTDGEYVDLSKGNFTVSTGAYAAENDAPVIDFASMTVSNPNPKLNENIYFKVKIQDASPVVNTYITYGFASGDLNSQGIYNSSTGYFEYIVTCSSYGKYEPLLIFAEDAFGNQIRYKDKNQSLFFEQYDNAGLVPEANMHAANATVQGSVNDTTLPTLDFSSIKIEKLYLARNEHTVLSFKAYDASGINCIDSDVWYAGIGGNSVACSFTYNAKTDRYEVDLESNYFGMHQIYGIRLRDNYGNTVEYTDANCEIYKKLGCVPEPNYVNQDLSASIFFVGLENKKTGTFVANSTMDDTTKLDVKELEPEGDTYEKLLPDDSNAKGFFEVDVTGACNMTNEDSTVCFEAPAGFDEGDELTIQHLLADGTVQTQVSFVTNGKVRIDVNQFSPFLVSAKKSKDKNQFTKKGLTYKLTGKTTAKVIGATKKNLKSLTIPATIKAGGKTYKITGIGDKAFSGFKKLKTIVIKSTKLKTVGKNAIKGIKKKAVIKVPKSKLKKYTKLFSKKTGFKKTMTIKK